ncbi:MAG: uroporphyrinogen decarboxylase [Sulfurospirillum sp.]|nr:uroporphyrinogen decarboxylase [Sulfurospirillum sp.]
MIFLDACRGKKTPYTPVWMMRQAGRYLPEYMEVRKSAGDFLGLCHDPQKACEVSLQPVDILGVDAAIVFTDILVVPLEMGMELQFIKGEGPFFPKPIETMQDIEALSIEKAAINLEYVYETIRLIRGRLAADKALIGFCGSPWTLATYMIEGQGSKTYAKVKKLIYTDPALMHALLTKITAVLKLYMENQIKSGIHVAMIFDSWAAALEEDAYFEFSWKYMKEISSFIKTNYPQIPVIMFPKGISGYLDRIDGDFDVFAVDWSTPMELAVEKLGDRYVLQGNMEPTRLYSKEAIKSGVEHIIHVTKDKKHIFNLGHGILPDIPVENAQYFIDLVQTLTKKV